MLRLTGTRSRCSTPSTRSATLFTPFLPTLLILGLQLPLLFFINFVILFGPLLFFGIKQMKAYEPGDADWGVKLDDVRGQAEPKEEVTRVISLWQSGEEFRRPAASASAACSSSARRAPARRCSRRRSRPRSTRPFMTMPGSGFAQTFIGMDVIVVRS